jgi:hypothetical protein
VRLAESFADFIAELNHHQKGDIVIKRRRLL